MPRPITMLDLLAQGDDPFPMSLRISRWERTEERHELQIPEAGDTLPPCLEVITSNRGQAARIFAVHRMRSLYEMGYPVLSDSALLFGDRLLPEELEHWYQIIRPGQALCLTDVWYNAVIPPLPNRQNPRSRDSVPTWVLRDERQDRIDEEVTRLEQVLHQGCHIVLALTVNRDLPTWRNLVDAPIGLVTVDEEAWRHPDGVLDYIITHVGLEDLTGGAANLNPPIPQDYDRLTPQMFEEALIHTSIHDLGPESENR